MKKPLRSWTLGFLNRGLMERPFPMEAKFCLAEEVKELEAEIEQLEKEQDEMPEITKLWIQRLILRALESETKLRKAAKMFNNLLQTEDVHDESQQNISTEIKGKKMTEPIRKAIDDELIRARKKFDWWPVNPVYQASIVAEEAGELIKASLQLVYKSGSREDIRKEAIQTAAMCIRLLEGK